MSKGRSRRRQKNRNLLFTVLAFVLVLGVSIGATTAFLVDRTDSVTNVFEPADIGIQVKETFNQQTKSNVSITNTEDVDVYVRVALIPVWEDGEENVVAESASLSDLQIAYGSSGDWQEGSDGFWYYTRVLEGNASTELLIQSAEVLKTSVGYTKGYQMNLQVMAQAIQAEPKDAVTSAWKVTVDEDGNLSVN